MGVTPNAPAIYTALFEDARDFHQIKKFPILYGIIGLTTTALKIIAVNSMSKVLIINIQFRMRHKYRKVF